MTPVVENLSLEQEAAVLNGMFQGLRRRGMILFAVSGAVWIGAELVLFAAMFAAALGWWGGHTVRFVGWTVTVLGLATAVILGLLRPIRKLRRADSVLLRIGEVYPAMASDVRSAGQLASVAGSVPFSPFLLIAEFRLIRNFLEKAIPEKKIYPKAKLIPPFAALLFSSGVFAAGWTTVPDILEAGAGAFFSDLTPPVRSRRVSEKAPVVRDLKVTLKYPEYLKREARFLDNVSGGFVAPRGTTVTLDGISLVNGATEGELHLPDDARVPLSVNALGEVRGEFVVGGGGTFFISLGTERLMVDGPQSAIEIEPDNPPTIRLLYPKGRVEMRESSELELEFEAEDDHGIARIDLVVRSVGGLEIRKTAVRLTDQIRRFKTKYRWAPESIRVDEDLDLQIEMEAFDDDTILGPKSGRSETVEVRVLTPESRHKSALEEQNAALDGLIDLLAFRMETPVPGGKQADQAFDRFAQVRGRTEDLLAKTAKLIAMLSKDSLTPRRVVETFVQIRQDLSNQLLFEGRRYENKDVDELKERMGVDKVTCRLLERAVIHVDDLVIEQNMSRLVQSGSTIESARSELFALLSRYKQNRSESVRRSLLSAIDRMEREMVQLEKNIEQIRGKVGDSYMSPTSMLRMDLLGRLGRLRSLLAGDDLTAALQLVRRMEHDLGRMLSALEGGLLSFRTERFGEGERFVGELLDRVMAVESEQLQLRRETIALKRSSLERLTDLMRGKIGPLSKRQRGHLDKMRRLQGELRFANDPTVQAVEEPLENALEELSLALHQGDLDEARRMALDVCDTLDDAKFGAGPKNASVLESLRTAAETIATEIEEASPRPAQLLTEKDGRQAEARAVEQRFILSKTRKLKVWIKKQADETRFLSSRATDALSVAVRNMVHSTAALESKQVGDSLEAQAAVLDALSGLREDLKRGGEVSPIESRPLVLNGRVDVPSPGEFEVPAEFREDILEAMRADLPGPYEEAIKKYYEALVQ